MRLRLPTKSVQVYAPAPVKLDALILQQSALLFRPRTRADLTL
jgi:hypothetical protein